MVNGSEMQDTSEAIGKSLPPECCGRCKWGFGQFKHPELLQQFGPEAPNMRRCHRFPPSHAVVVNPFLRPEPQRGQRIDPTNVIILRNTEYPPVRVDDLCGEFKPALVL